LFLKTTVCLQKQAQNRKKQPLFLAINSAACPSASQFGRLTLFPHARNHQKTPNSAVKRLFPPSLLFFLHFLLSFSFFVPR